MNNKFGGFSEFAIDFEMHTGREKYVTVAPVALRKARLFMFVPFTYLLLLALVRRFVVFPRACFCRRQHNFAAAQLAL
jgi:hypothetical protein